MQESCQQPSPEKEKEMFDDLIWVEQNLPVFWSFACAGHASFGRGAVVIDAKSEPVGEDTTFVYIDQEFLQNGRNKLGKHLFQLVLEYDPSRQIVIVFLKPLNVMSYQIEVDEDLIQAAKAAGSAEKNIDRLEVGRNLTETHSMHNLFETLYQRIIRDSDIKPRLWLNFLLQASTVWGGHP